MPNSLALDVGKSRLITIEAYVDHLLDTTPRVYASLQGFFRDQEDLLADRDTRLPTSEGGTGGKRATDRTHVGNNVG